MSQSWEVAEQAVNMATNVTVKGVACMASLMGKGTLSLPMIMEMSNAAEVKQRECEEHTKAKNKAGRDARKAAIKAEDMAKGAFIPVGMLPGQEPNIAAGA